MKFSDEKMQELFDVYLYHRDRANTSAMQNENIHKYWNKVKLQQDARCAFIAYVESKLAKSD